MKVFSTSAFLISLTFGTVRSESRGEDQFWHRFAVETLDSMAATDVPSVTTTGTTDAPTVQRTSEPTAEEVSNVPTEAPSVERTSVPSPEPTLGEVSFVPSLGNCAPIETILCTVPEFSTICDLIGAAGLSESLIEDTYTIFAPINDAFDSLPEEIADSLADDDDLLRNVILYHAVPEMEVLAENLVCDGNIMMANSEETTTQCTIGGVFQVGISNSPDALPQIIARDGEACNGIIHAIDQVLLPSLDTPIDPTPAPSDGNETEVPETCESIANIICDLQEFEILCALVGQAGLVDELSSGDKIFTVFAPVNSAFDNLPSELADTVTAEANVLEFLLLTHVVSGEFLSSDLQCGGEISMVSKAETTTVCEDDDLFQSGGGNSAILLPKVTKADTVACNGVIHTVDAVILPALE
jgi:uncharacterized surface protein with fasciclin (FAS1) repeats